MSQINCIIVDDEPIARDILQTHLSKLAYIQLLGTYPDALTALDRIEQGGVDLVLLDINMPDMTGLSLKQMLGEKVQVIFTTAHREFALEGFELNAVDYLLKPITLERLTKALSRYKARDTGTSHSGPDYMFVRADRKMVRIDFEEILYLESYSDYVKIHLTEGVIITREQISKLNAQLPENNFMRIHRSFVVSLNKVTAYTSESVEIQGQQLVLSRSYKEAVLERLGGG